LLVAAITVYMLPILINSVIVLYNQIRWNSRHLDNYTVEIGYYGPGGEPLQTVIVKDGKLVHSTVSFTRDSKTKIDEGFPFLNLTVNDLFSRAYRCFIYTFCRVEFDEVYIYPSYVGGGIFESAWITAGNLEPIKKVK